MLIAVACESGVLRKHSWLPSMIIPTLYLKEVGKAKHAYDIELEGLMRRYVVRRLLPKRTPVTHVIQTFHV